MPVPKLIRRPTMHRRLRIRERSAQVLRDAQHDGGGLFRLFALLFHGGGLGLVGQHLAEREGHGVEVGARRRWVEGGELLDHQAAQRLDVRVVVDAVDQAAEDLVGVRGGGGRDVIETGVEGFVGALD